jgi:hypothetical protein
MNTVRISGTERARDAAPILYIQHGSNKLSKI